MIKKMIFLLPRKQLEAEDSWRPILRRHISFFADLDSFRGFLDHIGGKSPFSNRILDLFDTFKDKDLRTPVTQWQFLDPSFRELVGKMTVMDPKKRISAKEALQHPWWNQTLWRSVDVTEDSNICLLNYSLENHSQLSVGMIPCIKLNKKNLHSARFCIIFFPSGSC